MLKIGNEGNPMRRGNEAEKASSGGMSLGQAVMESAKAILNRMKNPFNVFLPTNHYSPEGAETFDIERLVSIDPATTETVLLYTAKESQTIRFIRYGMFNNVVLGANVKFYPTINGNRILKWHGDPQDNFSLYLSVGPDLTENSLRPCDIVLTAGQTLEWRVANLSGSKADFGVRMRGYLINQNTSERGFGG